MGRRLAIDTDIGTDVDDLWTLAMLPGLAGIDLEAVTLVYGDTDVRARLASVTLAAMGIDVPVYRGCEQPLSGKAVMWVGHEGVGVPGLADAHYEPGDAVDVLIELAAAEPGSLDVLAIGPLMADEARRFWQFLSGLREGVPNDRSWAHDPLTLLALTAPEWFTFTRMAVAVEADGRVRGTPDETSLIEVATDLDPEGAHTAFLRTLGCPPPSAPKDM